ncbi:hypothetical protein CupriaWKF_12530 [Cupriavidus sp. WKF15]|uniref:hypothetical protein n=1 Tax=Cupriavidus sp. WKF15 TaxID=3032282 RepID=UPI0023E26930|nr:hypothetical protein [Cupriavidus sp. WKF15]WER45133.1 hypothetical protein CupriaWKF_12530 [Cupriavidus sp. WKF15]
MSRRPDDSSDQPMRRTWVWWVFFMPGAILMWFEYMFPSRGDVLASKRRHGNRLLQVWYSLGIYTVILVSLFFMFRFHKG